MIKLAELDKIAAEKAGTVLVELYKEAGAKSEAFAQALKDAWPKVLAATLGGSALLMIDRVFIDKITDYLDRRRSEKESVEYYQKMLAKHPKLRDYDPEEVAKYWESLYHFSPMVAKDPLGAGAFIVQSIERGYSDLYGGPTLDIYKTLSDIQKTYGEGKSKAKTMGEMSDKYKRMYTFQSDFNDDVLGRAKEIYNERFPKNP